MRLRRKKGQKDAGFRNEDQTAKRMGAATVPGSGAIEGFKGDLRRENYMIECKSTQNASMGVQLKWLRKVARESRDEGLRPALHLAFTHGDGNPVKDGTWIMIREVDFLDLLEQAGDDE